MSRPINERTWHRLPTSSSVRVHLMDWPDKGAHKGRPYHGGTRLPDRTPYPAEYLGRY